MAPGDPPQRHDRAPYCPVEADRLEGVRRATGLIAAAGRQEGRDEATIEGDSAGQKPCRRGHEGAPAPSSRRAPAKLLSNSWKEAVTAADSARTATSKPGPRCFAASTRSRRRARFRSTAVPADRGIANPTRVPGAEAANTTSPSRRERRPELVTRLKSAAVLSLGIDLMGPGSRPPRRTTGSDPWLAGS